MRKAQFEVAAGNRHAAFQKAHGSAAKPVTEAIKHGVRQLHQKIQNAQAEPGQPVKRVQKRGTKAGWRSHTSTSIGIEESEVPRIEKAQQRYGLCSKDWDNISVAMFETAPNLTQSLH